MFLDKSCSDTSKISLKASFDSIGVIPSPNVYITVLSNVTLSDSYVIYVANHHTSSRKVQAFLSM